MTLLRFAIGTSLLASRLIAQSAPNPNNIPNVLRICDSDQYLTFCGTWKWDGKKFHGQLDAFQSDVEVTVVQRQGLAIGFIKTQPGKPSAERFTGKMNAFGDGEGTAIIPQAGKADLIETWKSYPDAASHTFNLNGIWQKPSNGGPPEPLIRITQVGEDLQIGFHSDIETTGPFFYGKYMANPVMMGQNPRNDPATNKRIMVWQNYFVDDPDHIHNLKVPLVRVSAPGANDAPCDDDNFSSVDIPHAFLRGKSALDSLPPDFAKAACWYHAAAIQGHAKSQGIVGMMFHDGSGIPRDYARAFYWLQKGADGGDYYAQVALANVYRMGHGTPADPGMFEYWVAKADQHKPPPPPADAGPTLSRADKQRLAATVGVAIVGLGLLGLAAEIVSHDSAPGPEAEQANEDYLRRQRNIGPLDCFLQFSPCR